MSKQYVKQFIDGMKGAPILEIGPLINPLFRKDSHDVYYADVDTKEQLYDLYKNHNLCPPDELYDSIMPIDFVIHDKYLNACGSKKFSVVYSSHVIEHVEDVIDHISDLSNILDEEGYIAFVIPDKRYCFDYAREVTPFRDILDVHINGRQRLARLSFDFSFNHHNAYSIADYHNSSTKFSSKLTTDHYDGDILELYRGLQETMNYHGDHYWVFTYTSFLDILRDMLRANLLPFTLHYSAAPLVNTNEFAIILKKDTSILTDQRKRINEITRISCISEEFQDKTLILQQRQALSNLQNIQDQYYAIQNAFWWRITKPARMLSNLCKNIVVKNRHKDD